MSNEDRTAGAVKRPCTIKAANTVREGMPVKWDTGFIVESEGTTDDAFGIASRAGDGDDDKTKRIAVYMFGSGIVPVLCSGVVNQGAFATPGTDGVAAIVPGGGTVKKGCVGQMTEAGSAGKLAGCNLGMAQTVYTA